MVYTCVVCWSGPTLAASVSPISSSLNSLPCKGRSTGVLILRDSLRSVSVSGALDRAIDTVRPKPSR